MNHQIVHIAVIWKLPNLKKRGLKARFYCYLYFSVQMVKIFVKIKYLVSFVPLTFTIESVPIKLIAECTIQFATLTIIGCVI